MKGDFFRRVYDLVSRVPRGKVVTYGQIAAYLGDPKQARTVGWALHSNPDGSGVPCHRVVNREGRVAPGFAFGGPGVQRAKLEAEGVSFLDDEHVDLKGHLWQIE
ncbi:MAG: MGMT family protein [bacterium]